MTLDLGVLLLFSTLFVATHACPGLNSTLDVEEATIFWTGLIDDNWLTLGNWATFDGDYRLPNENDTVLIQGTLPEQSSLPESVVLMPPDMARFQLRLRSLLMCGYVLLRLDPSVELSISSHFVLHGVTFMALLGSGVLRIQPTASFVLLDGSRSWIGDLSGHTNVITGDGDFHVQFLARLYMYAQTTIRTNMLVDGDLVLYGSENGVGAQTFTLCCGGSLTVRGGGLLGVRSDTLDAASLVKVIVRDDFVLELELRAYMVVRSGDVRAPVRIEMSDSAQFVTRSGSLVTVSSSSALLFISLSPSVRVSIHRVTVNILAALITSSIPAMSANVTLVDFASMWEIKGEVTVLDPGTSVDGYGLLKIDDGATLQLADDSVLMCAQVSVGVKSNLVSPLHSSVYYSIRHTLLKATARVDLSGGFVCLGDTEVNQSARLQINGTASGKARAGSLELNGELATVVLDGSLHVAGGLHMRGGVLECAGEEAFVYVLGTSALTGGDKVLDCVHVYIYGPISHDGGRLDLVSAYIELRAGALMLTLADGPNHVDYPSSIRGDSGSRMGILGGRWHVERLEQFEIGVTVLIFEGSMLIASNHTIVGALGGIQAFGTSALSLIGNAVQGDVVIGERAIAAIDLDYITSIKLNADARLYVQSNVVMDSFVSTCQVVTFYGREHVLSSVTLTQGFAGTCIVIDLIIDRFELDADLLMSPLWLAAASELVPSFTVRADNATVEQSDDGGGPQLLLVHAPSVSKRDHCEGRVQQLGPAPEQCEKCLLSADPETSSADLQCVFLALGSGLFSCAASTVSEYVAFENFSGEYKASVLNWARCDLLEGHVPSFTNTFCDYRAGESQCLQDTTHCTWCALSPPAGVTPRCTSLFEEDGNDVCCQAPKSRLQPGLVQSSALEARLSAALNTMNVGETTPLTTGSVSVSSVASSVSGDGSGQATGVIKTTTSSRSMSVTGNGGTLSIELVVIAAVLLLILLLLGAASVYCVLRSRGRRRKGRAARRLSEVPRTSLSAASVMLKRGGGGTRQASRGGSRRSSAVHHTLAARAVGSRRHSRNVSAIYGAVSTLSPPVVGTSSGGAGTSGGASSSTAALNVYGDTRGVHTAQPIASLNTGSYGRAPLGKLTSSANMYDQVRSDGRLAGLYREWSSARTVYSGAFTDVLDFAEARLLVRAADVERLECIGSGYSGQVYRARWQGGIVALKEIGEALGNDKAQRAALLAEARRMMAIDLHPNVLPLLGVCANPLFILMPLCPNGSLDAFLFTSDDVVAPASALRYTRDVAFGLAHLHAVNVVHRDVAARNVLLGDDDRALISDFGLSRQLEAHDVAQGAKTVTKIGPLKWMAPEQLKRRVYSTQSDVWAFACLCSEIVDRRTPWANCTAVEAAANVRDGQLPVVERAAPPLLALMQRCWAYDSEKRCTMQEVCDALAAMSDTDCMRAPSPPRSATAAASTSATAAHNERVTPVTNDDYDEPE